MSKRVCIIGLLFLSSNAFSANYCIEVHENGSCKFEGEYWTKDNEKFPKGILIGETKYFDSNGNQLSPYSGRIKTYYENGNTKEFIALEDGLVITFRSYYPSGNIKIWCDAFYADPSDFIPGESPGACYHKGKLNYKWNFKSVDTDNYNPTSRSIMSL